MNDLKRCAERLSLISMVVGIAVAAAWIPLLWLASDTASAFLHAVFLFALPALAVAGLVLGVIGLIRSVRRETRSKKGIAFAIVGIVLNLLAAAASCWVLWMYLFVHPVEIAL